MVPSLPRRTQRGDLETQLESIFIAKSKLIGLSSVSHTISNSLGTVGRDKHTSMPLLAGLNLFLRFPVVFCSLLTCFECQLPDAHQ